MTESVKKLIFDNTDFKFKAAYQQYTDEFNTSQKEKYKTKLNKAITQLYEEKITYPDFYGMINREIDPRKRFHRTKITTTRKFAYRANECKLDRIKRHK
jgi:hypothetical protein